MTDLSKLMRQVKSGAPLHAKAPSNVGEWVTGAGKSIRMADMNEHHRENAIRKARREGRHDLAAELEASRPKGATT